MKTKIIQFIPTLIALAVIGFRYFSQWCISEGQACFRSFLDRTYLSITYPFFVFSLFLLPIVLILAFVPRRIFNSWLKFAMWALPLAFIYIAMTPVWDSSWLPFVRDDAARLAGGVFAVISLLLIAYKYFTSRRSKNIN